ncbi:DNA cytosine methyltransferase, partial [Streptococcus pneumoniae]|uniref:DNA cytosine methyltransferase n=1 Tax=Streptococcus pneumoniae TaxID=1313 RepID=UPI001E575F5C
AGLSLMTNKPNCAWNLSDLELVPKNGVKVMSTFACGGGSSMGYKRAGCTIVAANDIDPEMAWHYKRNLNPPLYFLCPIGELLTKELPLELYN